MGLFSKSNSSQYNDKLEIILENKNINNDTKNILLSMLYKIENSYEDYQKVKDVPSKDEFIENLLSVIKNECEIINAVTPKTEESRRLEREGKNSIINAGVGEILTIANEKDVLYAIVELNTEYAQYKYDKKFSFKEITEDETCMYKAIKQFIKKGRAMDYSEVIRDFNGWSWNTDIKNIEDISCNLIYQNLILLLGNEVNNMGLIIKNNDEDFEVNSTNLRFFNNIKEVIEENINVNIIQKAFQKLYLKETTENIVNDINTILLSMMLSENEDMKNNMQNQRKELLEKVKSMEDKKTFLNTLVKDKKQLERKIKEIDIILGNKELLVEEYENRNLKLKDENKIFSISHLAKILEEEKMDLLDKIKKNNRMMEPSGYIQEKEKILKKYKYLEKVISSINKEGKEELLKNIQIEFLKCFLIQVNQADTKEELIDLLYKFRYYCLLPINNLQTIKDIPEFKDSIKEVIDVLIDKCIDKKIIENISNSVSLCYNTLKYIFSSRIVDLEKINIKITKNKDEIIENNGKKEKLSYITISLYDSKEEEEQYDEVVNNLELLNIKTNKKIALFV